MSVLTARDLERVRFEARERPPPEPMFDSQEEMPRWAIKTKSGRDLH